MRDSEGQQRGWLQVVTKPWFKSSYSCGDGQCLETMFSGRTVSIRDSKYAGDPATRPIINVPVPTWMDFLDETRGIGREQIAGLSTEHQPGGGVLLRSPDGETTLSFTTGEWTAFRAGVEAGEFDPQLVPA